VRNSRRLAEISEQCILRWAEAYRSRTGAWPNKESGAIPEAPGETWSSINVSLVNGTRGLPGGSTLARMLNTARGHRTRSAVPRLTLELILRWADEHHEHTGRWPNSHSGIIASSHGETWSAVWTALLRGTRGLPSGWTLPKLLSEYRGVPHEARCKRGS